MRQLGIARAQGPIAVEVDIELSLEGIADVDLGNNPISLEQQDRTETERADP